MSKNNVRIAIRDSTDSHNVAFFDNQAGIKYKSANLQRFLAGSASILTIKYNSKDIDTIRSGCKLAFRYKNRDYWLNVMSFEKKGFEVELTAYSLGLELNNETRGEHKPANAMSITEYVAYYDPEHALTIGVNEVSDKRIKLEWTGTDTILARLFSVANSFGAELDFNVELNDDYSLKRQVLNIYKKGNLGTNKVSQPVRVGKELKVINYSDNIKELRTAVRATGKDGLTIDGLDKKIYDNNKELLYYSSGMTVYAPQSRDRFPSVGKGSNDNWIVEDLGETQYETKEALWGYLYSEIQKKSVPEITYEVEGAVDAGIGDTQTLIDDKHFEPALYVQARVSELEDDILTGKVTKSTFINFERKYSQIADILLKQVEALAEDAAPYIIRLSTNNGYIFKNGEGSSTITARLEKYSKDIAATWKWVVDNKVVGTGDKLTVKAEQVTNTMAVTVIAYVNGNEVVRDYMTFSNSDDGVGVESIDRYFTSSDQSDGVTIEGAEWSDKPPAPTEDGKYLWAYDEITYTDGTVTTTKPAAVGANFDVDAFRAEIAEDLKDVPNREEFENKIAEELANSKAEIETQIETAKTQAESNAKEYADTINEETAKVAELANAAAGEIKADLVNVKDNLTETSLVANNAQAAVDAAKQDLTNVTNELNTAKQDLMSHTQQLQTQANAQTELTKRVTTVEATANGTKTTVSELSKTVDSNTKNITSVTARTKVVEDDLSGTKTTLSQVKTTADSASQKTATLETGLDGLSAKFDNLNVGGTNLIKQSTAKAGTRLPAYAGELQDQAHALTDWIVIEPSTVYTLTTYEDVNEGSMYYSLAWYSTNNADYSGWISRPTGAALAADLKGGRQYASPANAAYAKVSYPINYPKVKFERGNVSTDYSQNGVDLEQKVAEYKQTADQNYASLQSNLQTLDGTVKQNKSEFDQTASQIKSSISAVESKIPTAVGGRNLLSKTNQGKTNWEWAILSGWVTAEDYNVDGTNAVKLTRTADVSASWSFIQYRGLIRKLIEPDTKYTLSFDVKPSVDVTFSAALKRGDGGAPLTNAANMNKALANKWTKVYCVLTSTTTLPDDLAQVVYLQGMPIANGNWLIIKNIKLEKGAVPSDWSPAPEDTASQISSLSSQIQQTADGMTLLATKTELNSAKTELQSGITTATNKANSNAQTISTHTTQISALNTGLSAKVSQSDFNTLSGRVTTAENNITAKANELSSKITKVEGKIPTNIGTVNLIKQSTAQKGLRLGMSAVLINDDNHMLTDWIKVEPSTVYTLTTYEDVNEGSMYYSLAWYSTNNADYSGWINRPTGAASSADLKNGRQYASPANAAYAKVSYPINYSKVKLERGNIATDYSPNPEDYDAALTQAQSEFKQTTDAIKASVSSLDSSTVKSSSLTINADGIVMKAGKSTTDVANAIGSYFAVNQNAINLFSDKINVKGNMIVNGAITSDKIASKSINTAHLNGKIITADVIATNAVTADAIKAGAVTTDKMSANSINGDRITAGTLDAAKIKAGSITASQIASGTITSNQIQAGGISAANIATGAITTNKIAAGAIDTNKIAANAITADKIAANAITADMITGGKLNSKNGATVFDLNAGTITFNNNSGYIERVAGDKIFAIQTWLGADSNSRDWLASSFSIRKSDNSRRSGIQFQLYNDAEDKPTAFANIWADSFHLGSSKGGFLFYVDSTNNVKPSWGDIPIAHVNGGLLVKDIEIGGHSKSLLNIVEELCKKAGIIWV